MARNKAEEGEQQKNCVGDRLLNSAGNYFVFGDNYYFGLGNN